MGVRFESLVGRYMHVDLGTQTHRLYWEEAGQGIPLLCLHTAGSDGRQYREILNNPAICEHFRVVVFDMPWHGKSSPPPGWQDEEYVLTTSRYVELILAVADALEMHRPIAMGCSIGGRIVLKLAADYGDRFGGVIGLQSGAKLAPYYDTSWLHRCDVHGGEVCAGVVSGLIAPQAPLRERWETLWHYMQGGPGVFKGDLYFYKFDGDMSDELSRINSRNCPVHLLTGEYDYSCTVEESRAAAVACGATFTPMASLGHFPMSEDPVRFTTYLQPVLEALKEWRLREGIAP